MKHCALAVVKALTEDGNTDIEELSFEERLGLLVDREMTELRRLPFTPGQTGKVQDIEPTPWAGVTTGSLTGNGSSQYHDTGPTAWIACAWHRKPVGKVIGHFICACRNQELPIAKGDGTYIKLLTRLAKMC